jgi:hypothetical protein
MAIRMKHALEIARRVRPSVYEQWGQTDRKMNGHSGLTIAPPPPVQ